MDYKKLSTSFLEIVTTLFLLTLTLLANASPTQELEPNNSIVNAQPIPTLSSIGGTISEASDVDIYAFRAELGETIHIDTLARGFRATNSPGSNLSAKITLLDTDGTTVLNEDSSIGDYDDPFISFTFSASG